MQATLIPVKTHTDVSEDFEGYKLILKHISDNPGHEKCSVVLQTSGTAPVYTRAEAMADETLQPAEELLRKILDKGIPVVLAAGNNDPYDENKKIINSAPQVYQDDEDFPLINVGAADFEGKRVRSSRYGDQLTIYAPGKDVASLPKEGLVSKSMTGTSIGE